MKTTGSIRKRLIISLVILAIVPLLLLGAVLSWQDSVIQRRQAMELQSEIAKRVSGEILSKIHEQETTLLNAMKIDYYITEIGRQRQHQILSKLRAFKDENHRDSFNDLVLLNGNGREIMRVSRASIFTDRDLGDRSGAEEFLVPIAKRATYYGPVYFDKKTGGPFMLMSLPVIDERGDKLKGVLVAEMRLKFMQEIVAAMHIGKSGIAYITDNDGRVIVHPDPSVMLKDAHFHVPDKAVIMTGINGTKVVLAGDTIKLGDQYLHIVTEVPVTEALKNTARPMLTIAAFLLFTLSVALALGFTIMRKIIRPIESLAETAQAISSGNLSQKAAFSGSDEIGVLSLAFNKMTSQLIDTIDSLQHTVYQREAANVKLLERTEEKEVLLKEIHHRVKNNMQVISSLLSLQSDQIDDRQYIELFDESRNRIRSMSLIHEKLYQSNDLAHIDFNDYVKSLANGLLMFYGTNNGSISLNIKAEELSLAIDTAIPCGLIINELVSNALKYAFPKDRKGEIKISFRKITGEDKYELVVSDNGAGIPEGIDIRAVKSLGMQLIVNLVEHQLKGELALDRSSGTKYFIRFKELKYKNRI
ncbi:MAG: HAMP domain-containing protein [Nitrospirae bacterium]|nr:HAMP domain-containing protein [Nitrospirota bacterium]